MYIICIYTYTTLYIYTVQNNGVDPEKMKVTNINGETNTK